MAYAERNLTEQAMIAFFTKTLPAVDADSAKELAGIEAALAAERVWKNDEEWRISTWLTSTIKVEAVDGKDWYLVTVECDGQSMSCRSPSVQRAFMFYRLYCHLIVYEFYSVGPPWAG